LEVASMVSQCHSQVFVSVSQLEVTAPTVQSPDWIVQAFLNFQCQTGSKQLQQWLLADLENFGQV